MRTGFLAAVAGVCLAAAALAAPAVSLSRSPGSIHLFATLEPGTAPETPAVRWVTLPPGATDIHVEHGRPSDEEVLAVGSPMVLRGLTVLPVTLKSRTASATKAEPSTAECRISFRQDAPRKTASDPIRYGRGFFSALGEALAGEEAGLPDSPEEGAYLIVSAPDLASTVEPLARWKREMGFHVTLVTTSETGTGNAEIREYIRSLYETAAVPPQYVVLVGDVEQIPGWDYHQSVSDLPYALVDGDDFLPDLYVGRLSARNTGEAATIVAKILRYEMDPFRSDSGWFSRALLVAGDYSSSTPVPVSRWAREVLRGSGFSTVDSVFYPPHWSTGPMLIRSSINAGVSLVSYRGWAYGWQGWEPPKWTVTEIPSLSNGWKLPAVFSFVCLTGNYAEPECFGEAWIRAGSATEPKGAVAFIGNSEHWSHTRFNDAAAIGAFRAIGESGARRMGDILHASKFEIYREFPDLVYYADHADESVEFYFYIYSLLGDPSMEIWMGEPRAVAVARPDTIAKGSNFTFVTVTDPGTGDPVEGARVGLSQNGERLGSAFTNSLGEAVILGDFDDDGSLVTITVTGTGLLPNRDSVSVVSNQTHLGLAGVSVRDDGTGRSDGNGDGKPGPGETIEIRATLRNGTASQASNVTGFLNTLSSGNVPEAATVGFPDIAPGGTAASDTTWTVRVADGAEDGQVLRFLLRAYTGGIETDNGFDLAVSAPALAHESHAAGADGVLSPGETTSLLVTVRNEGSAPLSAPTLVLRSETPLLASVIDSASSFASIEPGASGTTAVPFTIQATDSAAVGQGAVFTLVATTTEGIVRAMSFTVVVGVVDHRAPLGPDAYGYYAYDNSDTDYPDSAPVFEWVPCSPNYGGSGAPLHMTDDSFATVTLPFPFTFYGRTYTRLLISDNGWASFDTLGYYDFYNWSLPTPYGVAAQIAPFWDNLDPAKAYDGQRVGDDVYVFSDEANHRFVVEWSRMGNLRPHHENRLDWDDLQTFEMILFDPARVPTPTGDGVIRFQYKQVVNDDFDRMYASVGIEDETETIGLEYTYSNMYPAAAAPLSAGLAVDFTTKPPRYDPFVFASFRAEPSEGGVRLSWEPCDERPRGPTIVYRASAEGARLPVAGGLLAPAAREFLDAGAAPDSVLVYWIGSLDPAGSETLLGPFKYEGTSIPRVLALEAAGPNPFRGSSVLRYSIPARTEAALRIYSVSGRLMRSLPAGGAGAATVMWDGRDENGRDVPSGVYFARLEAGEERRSVKLLLFR